MFSHSTSREPCKAWASNQHCEVEIIISPILTMRHLMFRAVQELTQSHTVEQGQNPHLDSEKPGSKTGLLIPITLPCLRRWHFRSPFWTLLDQVTTVRWFLRSPFYRSGNRDSGELTIRLPKVTKVVSDDGHRALSKELSNQRNCY